MKNSREFSPIFDCELDGAVSQEIGTELSCLNTDETMDGRVADRFPATHHSKEHDSVRQPCLGLPLEVLMMIFEYCDIQALARCQSVCQLWRSIVIQDA